MNASNNPPPYEALSMHIEDLFVLVSDSLTGGEVTTDDQDAALDALLDDVRKAKKDADAARVVEKKPHDEAAKAVQERWKPILDRCDAATGEIKRVLTPYRNAKQKAKDEAARIAREEAEAKEKAAREVLQQSDSLEEKFAAEEQLKQASKLTKIANRIDREATGLRTSYRAEVTDYGKLLAHYKITRPDALKAWLDSEAQTDVRMGCRVLPGVIVHEERSAA
ncbi:MAG: hypothetical protein IT423_07290 [Pirellulaceae bacterium]|nr:hypothetical protein [Pirellulaceae bacterium]